MESSSPFAQELRVAMLAVHHASVLTKRVTESRHTGAFAKSDRSPVTIADFGAQALLISSVHTAFPEDGFIGEESAVELRRDEVLREGVWGFVKGGEGGGVRDVEEMMRCVDLGAQGGNKAGGKGSGKRCWMLDPVDGTRAFMRGEQYAVSLALIIEGKQKIGVLGCPNLSLEEGCVREDLVDTDGLGWIIYAVEGQGAWRRKMSMGALGEPIKMERIGSSLQDRPLRWIESQTKNRDIAKQSAVAKAMGAEWPGTDIWSMQMKYMAVAVGGNDALVRISPEGYRGYVWDHAGGQLICAEVGIKITDAWGNDFDFSKGRRLEDNWGVIAAVPELHSRVLEEVTKVVRNKL